MTDHVDPADHASEHAPAKKEDPAVPAHSQKPPEADDEELISPHPGIGGILADPVRQTDRRGG